MEQEFKQQSKHHIPENLVSQVGNIEKATFYRKTYMHVGLAVLVFMALESLFLTIDPLVNFMLSMLEGYKWLIIIGLFWLGSAMSERLSHSENKSTQYLGLVFYAALEAIIFIPLIYIATAVAGDGSLIYQAAMVTLGLFAALTAVVLFTKANFSFLRTFLIFGTFIALGAIVAGMIFGFNLGLWFSVGMVIFASAAILYQTSLLKNEFTTDQYVGAAVGVFASVMLLFWYVLSIFISRD